MPELPEVETIKMQLNQALRGLQIADIEILSKKNFIGQLKEVIDEKVKGVERRAKMILIKLGNGKFLAIHLKLTGQLIYREKQVNQVDQVDQENGPFAVKELPNKFTRVIINLTDGSKLFFNDLRKFGWVKVISKIEEIGGEKLGPEANNEKEFSISYFKEVLNKSKKPVKLILMDQEKLAGVGNIYANEALFAAGIMPTRPANSLTEKEIEQLRNTITRILRSAIAYQGTSDRDEAYRQISGEKGNFQKYLRVYGRVGQKCPNCRGKIKKIQLGGRGTFYCLHCQR